MTPQKLLTQAEYEARAALLGMRYHPGNDTVPPFFYHMGGDDIPIAVGLGLVNAVTLEVMTERSAHKFGTKRVANHAEAALRLLYNDFGANKL